MRGTIYVLKNNITEKYYVGQTIGSSKERFNQHKRVARSGAGYLLHSSIRKHGECNFILVEERHAHVDELDKLERDTIIEYNSCQPNGYNILEFGTLANLEEGWWKGKVRAESTKQKISETKIANGDSVGEKNPFYGKRHSPEVQALIVQKAAEWRATPEAQAHMAAANKIAAEKRIGHTVSEETREKLRQANKGRQPSELARQRSRETKLGTKASAETKAKMSASHLGKKMPVSHSIKSRENNINRITDEQKARVYKVREMIAEGKQNTEIARITNFHYEMIRKIRNGTRYGWLK